MFPGAKKGEFEPYRVREKKTEKEKAEPAIVTNGDSEPGPSKADVEMPDQPAANAAPTNGGDRPEQDADEEDGVTYEEDPTRDEGAVYPIQEGKIVDWACFYALITHVYNKLSPPFHTPILMVAQPAWTSKDHEMISQFMFEKFKIPAFTLMDTALAATYAYGATSATVVDVGYQKVDVTAVSDYTVVDVGRSVAIPGCGGEGLTQRLLESLGPAAFTRDMCEQLKKSAICEILPAGTPLPGSSDENQDSNPAAAASTGATRRLSFDGAGDDAINGEDDADHEGVLDVASIVASGRTSEYLAQKEKEKALKAAIKKGTVTDTSAGAKPTRLPNAKRERAAFTFEKYTPTGDGTVRLAKREIEVGFERFFAGNPSANGNIGILENIAAAIHRTILAVPDVSQRSTLWDNLIIIGNGSKIRGTCLQSPFPSITDPALGFTPSLLAILNQKYLLTPSSATIFTSELPSTLSTPLPTGGTNTPLHGGPQPGPSHHPAAHGVNPLLVAATHASQNQPGGNLLHPSSADPLHQHPSTPQHQTHRSAGHAQTPTSIKTVKQPDYFPEWKDAAYSGFEEAAFLGAQEAAKVVFVIDQGATKGFMTRGEWNDIGPSGLHEFMLVI
jgi:actin-related protein 9